MWFRRRCPKKRQKRLEMLAELRGRAAVREAEEIVASAWADQLTEAVQSHPGNQQPLEYQQLRLIRAARKRARAAERDRRQLVELGEDPADVAQALPSFQHRRGNGSS